MELFYFAVGFCLGCGFTLWLGTEVHEDIQNEEVPEEKNTEIRYKGRIGQG